MWQDDIGDAVMVYGVQTAKEELDMSAPVVEYGAPFSPTQPGPVAPAQRDAWWKWAVGAGVVSVAAYGIYLVVTKG
jgi:hypothetical protein